MDNELQNRPHMTRREAVGRLMRLACNPRISEEDVVALEMGARRMMCLHFQKQRSWAKKRARHVPPLSPEEELADTIARQKEAE